MSVASIIKMYSQRLWRYLRRSVNTDADAEDLLQEVWFQFSNLPDPEEIGEAGAWLFKVARNKLIDRSRKAHLQEERIEDLLDENLFAAFSDPAEKDLQDLFWHTLQAALAELPQKQREVFIRNELEEKTLQEIADEQGENIKTIISRKGYAVAHLRKRLYQLYNEFFN